MKNALKIVLLVALNISLTFAQNNDEYRGSSFSQIKNLLTNQTVAPQDEEGKEDWQLYGQGLPQYHVTRSSFIKDGINLLLESAKRTTTQNHDFYPRLTKLVHPNGVCLLGTWNITEETPYTGYFEKGRSGLFIGRASVALSATERGHARAFGLAGKIFPTLNKDEVVKTANFFSVDDLGGTMAKHFTDVALTNEPALSVKFSLLKLLLAVNTAFKKADSNPGMRPLYPISELGLTNPSAAKTPKWFKLEADVETVKNDEADFRNELNIAKNYPAGLRINIYTSDTTHLRNQKNGWVKVGHIQLNESVVSYGCDRQLHFAHPKIK